MQSNTHQIDHSALTAALKRHGFHGRALPLQPMGWIRRDGELIHYGDRHRTYQTGGAAE